MERFSEIVLRKLWIVLLFVILFSGAAYIGYSSWAEPEYKAFTNLYISKRTINPQGEEIVSYYNQLEGELVLSDCKSLIPSYNVLKEVADKLGFEDYTEIKAKMNVRASGSARTMVVAYRNSDEDLAIEVLEETIVSFLGQSSEFFPNTPIYRIDTIQTTMANDYVLVVVAGAACFGASMGILTVFLFWMRVKKKDEYKDNVK